MYKKARQELRPNTRNDWVKMQCQGQSVTRRAGVRQGTVSPRDLWPTSNFQKLQSDFGSWTLSDLAITRNRRIRRGGLPACSCCKCKSTKMHPSINRAIDLTVASSCEGLQKGRITDQPELNLLDHINGTREMYLVVTSQPR